MCDVRKCAFHQADARMPTPRKGVVSPEWTTFIKVSGRFQACFFLFKKIRVGPDFVYFVRQIFNVFTSKFHASTMKIESV